MSDETEPREGLSPDWTDAEETAYVEGAQSEAELRASALAGELDQCQRGLAAVRDAAEAAAEQAAEQQARAVAAEKRLEEIAAIEARRAELEETCVLTRDAIVDNVPRGINTRVAKVELLDVSWEWFRHAVANGTVRPKARYGSAEA